MGSAVRSRRLRRSDCAGEGIVRRRHGRGFAFVDADGERVEDPETLERIAELAIPPAWQDVWVCPDPFGHIQATGTDASGRKQYLYHPRWQQCQAERKFEAVREFAVALPRLRRAVTADLKRRGMPRERALACAVRLLDLGFFRVGGETYAEENESFGLATIRREHVTISGDEAAAKRSISAAVKRVAEALGNTPAVCRRSYIDPRVLDRFRDGEQIQPTANTSGRLSAKRRMKIEREVLRLIS